MRADLKIAPQAVNSRPPQGHDSGLTTPTQVMYPMSKERLLRVSDVSSEGRKPVAYRTSSIALSLRPRGTDKSGCARSESTSGQRKYLWQRLPDFWDSTTLTRISFQLSLEDKELKKIRKVIRALATERLSGPPLWRELKELSQYFSLHKTSQTCPNRR
jgi:hypothetical protein